MTVTDWAVVAAGAALIGWINWYFFLAQPAAVTAAVDEDLQEVRVRVEGGYEPADIRLRAGVPVRLLFDRREASPCSEEVVLPDFGIRRFLPPGRTTAMEFVADRPGQFAFTCGMSMLRGRLTVVAAEAR